MKKIFIGFTCLMLMFMFSGCAAAPLEPSFTGRKPWQFIETSKDNNERMEFSAVRYSYNGLEPTKIASGKLNFNLKESAATTELSTSLTLDFNENSDFKGKVNTVNSKVIFNSGDISPVYSEKTLHHAAAQTERGYTAQTDYAEKKTTVTLLSGESKEFKLKNGEYYDNEMLYHIIRAIPELKAGSNYTFRIATPYDMYTNNKYFTHKIKVSVATTLVRLPVPKEIFDMSIPRGGDESGKLDDGGEYLLDCIAVRVSLSADKSGPSFNMYLSDLHFIDNEEIRAKESAHAYSYTSMVPIKIVVEELKVNSALAFANEYNLISYSTL